MDIEKKIANTVRKYKLLSKKDRVVVALSGGKDSTSVFYILHKLGYNVQGLFIDLHLGNWSKKNKENVVRFCRELGVKLKVVDLRKEFGSGICFIKQIVKQKKNLTGCSVCGVLKRWILNKWARKLGGTKLVTGHNLDDECQTVLMNFLKGNVMLGLNSGPWTGFGLESVPGKVPIQISPSARPTLNKPAGNDNSSGVADIGFIQRVKPMFFVPESEIKKYSKKMEFPVLYERCPCAFGTYRVETRAWLDKLSDNEKLKIVKGWLGVVPGLRKKVGGGVVGVCEGCGEPTRNDVCKACEVLGCLKHM